MKAGFSDDASGLSPDNIVAAVKFRIFVYLGVQESSTSCRFCLEESTPLLTGVCGASSYESLTIGTSRLVCASADTRCNEGAARSRIN